MHEENQVIIPLAVIEELDGLKNEEGENLTFDAPDY